MRFPNEPWGPAVVVTDEPGLDGVGLVRHGPSGSRDSEMTEMSSLDGNTPYFLLPPHDPTPGIRIRHPVQAVRREGTRSTNARDRLEVDLQLVPTPGSSARASLVSAVMAGSFLSWSATNAAFVLPRRCMVVTAPPSTPAAGRRCDRCAAGRRTSACGRRRAVRSRSGSRAASTERRRARRRARRRTGSCRR